jgi:hypothetical protein
MGWRFFVVDGANQGQSFVLPLEGTVTIGRSQKHADIILHDLYVARVHCEVVMGGEGDVLVRALPDATAGLILNGSQVREGNMKLKDILRLGNSHLRLEPYDHDHPDEEQAAEDEEVVEVDVAEEEAEEFVEAEEVEEDEEAPAEPGKLPVLRPERFEALSGQVFSHYKLGEVIGRGHCGVVFHAQHLASGTELAMKVLSPEFPGDAQEMKTFVLALKAILGKKHPNLVTLYNAGKTGPYCWLALEHVEGDSLAQALREPDAKRRSHWKLALRMGIQLARALEFLRKNKLVHGNITPANVLMASDEMGRDKEVKLGDLMLSRALEGSALAEARREKKLEAELGYMAPEQLMEDAPVDWLADLYGLGAVLYARLTGGPPLQARTPAEALKLINRTVPKRPTDFHANIPERLSTAVMLLLARHPEDRYQSPAELRSELEEIAEDEGLEV